MGALARNRFWRRLFLAQYSQASTRVVTENFLSTYPYIILLFLRPSIPMMIVSWNGVGGRRIWTVSPSFASTSPVLPRKPILNRASRCHCLPRYRPIIPPVAKASGSIRYRSQVSMQTLLDGTLSCHSPARSSKHNPVKFYRVILRT